MKTTTFALAGLLSACLFATPAVAQDDSVGAAMERDAQAMRDQMERDAGAMRDSAEHAGQPVQDGSEDADTKDSQFDEDGNYQGCHGIGCEVDNPDRATGENESSSQSSSSSSSVSVDFGRPHGGNHGSWSTDSVLGQWTLGEKNGSSSCTLTLSSEESFGLKQAWTNIGCPDGFFSVNRWRAAGRDLQLTDMGGTVIGSFRQVGPDRFEGRRDKDGAPMFLSR